MTTYSIKAPNGQTYQIEGPAGASADEVAQAVLAQNPEAGVVPRESTIGSELVRGAKQLGSSLQTGIGALFGSPEAAAQAGVERGQAIGEAAGEGPSFERARQAYETGGIGGAAKEVAGQIPRAIAGQLPQMAALATGARLGATAGAARGPVGAVVGGAMGAGATLFPSFFGSDIERQAAEQLKAGQPVSIDRGSAALAATGQVALEGAGTAFTLGKRVVKGVLGIADDVGLQTAAARTALEATAKRSLLATTAQGVARGLAVEIPVEIAQQVLERAQAGLDILSPDAFSEYGETAYQTGLAGGPFGAAGRIYERSGARGELAKEQADIQEAGAAERRARQAAQREAAAQQVSGIKGEKILDAEAAEQAKVAKAEEAAAQQTMKEDYAQRRAEREAELKEAFPADYSDVMERTNRYGVLATELASLTGVRKTPEVKGRIRTLQARMADVAAEDDRIPNEFLRMQRDQVAATRAAGFPAKKSAAVLGGAFPAQMEMREALAPVELPPQTDLFGAPLLPTTPQPEGLATVAEAELPLTSEVLRDAGIAPTTKELEAAGQQRLPLRKTPAGQPTSPVRLAAPAPAEVVQELPAVTPAPAEPTQPGAITATEVRQFGTMSKANRQWVVDNIEGRTPEQVRDMVEADPTIIPSVPKGLQTVLKEIVATAAPKETPSVQPTPAPVPEVEPQLRARRGKPSMAVSGEPAGAELLGAPAAEPARAEELAPPVGLGLAPAGQPAGERAAPEVTGKPALDIEEAQRQAEAKAVIDALAEVRKAAQAPKAKAPAPAPAPAPKPVKAAPKVEAPAPAPTGSPFDILSRNAAVLKARAEEEAAPAKAEKPETTTKHRVTYDGKPATLEIIRRKDNPSVIVAARVKVDGERLASLNMSNQGTQSDAKFIGNLLETDVLDSANEVAPTKVAPAKAEAAPAKAEAPEITKAKKKVNERLDDLDLDPDTTKAKVRAVVKQAQTAGLIDARDAQEIERIGKDRDMGPEDMISELRSAVEVGPADAPAKAEVPPPAKAALASVPLTKAETARLEEHYGADRTSPEFWSQLQDDVVALTNKGLAAVNVAVRKIIQKIAQGVLAVGVVFNPNLVKTDFDFNLPQTYKTTVTKQVKAEVPAEAKAKMSTLAQSVYESMAPTAKASGKGFIIADKPNGMLHVFFADGSLLIQDAALYGKDIGDIESKLSSLQGGAKITPAGKFTLVATPDAEYAGGMRLDLKETSSAGGVTAIHAAYLGDAKEKRLERLASTSAFDKRISYGCVNTTHATFLKSILPNIEKLNGGMIFVLPDAQADTAAMFPVKSETTTLTGTEKEAAAKPTSSMAAKEAERPPEAPTIKPAPAIRTGLASTSEAVEPGQSIGSLRGEILRAKGALGSALRRAIASGKVVLETRHPDGGIGGYFDGEKVTLYAEGIPAGQAMAVALHEIGAHMGFKNLFGERVYNNVIKQIQELAASKVESADRALAQAAMNRIPESDKARGAEVYGDETLAYFIEEAVKAQNAGTLATSGPVRALFNNIRLAMLAAINRVFGSKLGVADLTARDILSMAEGAFIRESFSRVRKTAEAGKGRASTISDAFKRWFGDSKVVDENGKPLVVSHISKAEPTVFDDKYKTELSSMGFHFGTKEQAEFRGTQYDFESRSPTMGDYYLSIQNPLEVSHMASYAPDHLADQMMDMDLITEDKYDALRDKYRYDLDIGAALVKILQKAGYDGLVYSNEKEGEGNSYVPFKPTQIKSATSNIGTYDPTSPDIRYSRTAKAQPITDIITDMDREMPVEDTRPLLTRAADALREGIPKKIEGVSMIQRVANMAADQLDAGEPLMREIRKEVRASLPPTEANEALVALSYSQASHDGGVATAALDDGGIEYNDELAKFTTEKSGFNRKAVHDVYKRMAKTYGMTMPQARYATSTALESKRMLALYDTQADMLANAEVLKAAGSTAAATKMREKAESYIFHMTRAQAETGMELFKAAPEISEIEQIKEGMRGWIRKHLQDTGVWSEETGQWMLDNAEWIPFNREAVEAAEGDVEAGGFNAYVRGLQVKAKEKAFKGSMREVHDVMDNFESWSDYSVRRGILNKKAADLATAALEYLPESEAVAVKTPMRNAADRTVSYLVNGEPQYVEFASAAKAQIFKGAPVMARSALPVIGGLVDSLNSVFRGAILNFPLFPIYQLAMDSISAIYISGLSPKYAYKIPVLAVKEALATLRNASVAHERLRSVGATGVHDYNATLATANNDVTSRMKSLSGFEKYVALMHKMNLVADNAVRQGVYLAARDSGLSEAAAVEKAFEIINFRTRVGNNKLAAAARNVVFLNSFYAASRAALKVLSNEGISPTEREQAKKTLLSNLAWLGGISFVLALSNIGDDDYEKMSRQEQAGKLTLPGMHGWGIPLRPDVFMLVKVMAEMIARQGFSEFADDQAKVKATISDALGSALLSGPVPVAQPIKVAVELATNHSFFTGRPLVGRGLETQEAFRQFSTGTSELAKGIGASAKNLVALTGMKSEGISPVKIDHVIQGMLGMYGGALVLATNSMVNGRPTQSMQDTIASLPGMGRIGVKEFDSQIKSDFYDLAQTVHKAVDTANRYKAQGMREEYQEYTAEKKKVIKYGGAVQQIERQLSNLRNSITAVAANKSLTPEARDARILELRNTEKRMLTNLAPLIKKMRTEALS